MSYHVFLNHSRGGGPFTVHINQPLGAHLARLAHELKWSASTVSLVAIFITIITAISVIVSVESGHKYPAALILLLGCHLAYSLDCADGQLARATSTASESGAALDILCDAMGQSAILSSVGVAMLADTGRTHLYFLLIPATLANMFGLITSAALSRLGKPLARTKRSVGTAAVRLLQDYGLHVTAWAIAVAIGGAVPLVALTATGALHALFLLGRIARLSAPQH
jgi:phosphatidylglycerophosphate synthase